MTGRDEFDRTLARWLEADAQSSRPTTEPGAILDAVRGRTPRPAWLAGLGSQWIGEAPGSSSGTGMRSLPRLTVRVSAGLIVVGVIAAIVAGVILVGSRPSPIPPVPLGRLGHLAYGVEGDIYVADWDGKSPIRIANGAQAGGATTCSGFWGEGSIWSPDGRYLAYRSTTSCDAWPGIVYLSNPQGHVVASIPATGWLVSWSPDSKRVAVWADLTKTIGIYGLDGVRQALLTVPPGCKLPGDFDPLWSPDATSVVVWPCEVPIDGRTPGQTRPDDPRSNADWAYSPDGTRVAYITSGSLLLAQADGSQHRVLIPNGVTMGAPGTYSPVWSPSGDRIAFDGGPSDSGSNELRIVDVTSGRVISIATAKGTDSLRVIRFSPEGDRILYASLTGTPATVGSLWTVRSDGSDPERLVSGSGWGDWQWLPASP